MNLFSRSQNTEVKYFSRHANTEGTINTDQTETQTQTRKQKQKQLPLGEPWQLPDNRLCLHRGCLWQGSYGLLPLTCEIQNLSRRLADSRLRASEKGSWPPFFD